MAAVRISRATAAALAADADNANGDDIIEVDVYIQHKYECKSCGHFNSPKNDFCTRCGIANPSLRMTAAKKQEMQKRYRDAGPLTVPGQRFNVSKTNSTAATLGEIPKALRPNYVAK